MASIPFRRRGKLSSAAKTARNVAIAEAAWALARDRLPGVETRKSHRGRKLVLIGGAAAVVGGALFVKREQARKLLPGGSSPTEPWSPPAPPQQSNYDAPGPVANTATPIPAPDPVVTSEPERTADVVDEPAEPAESFTAPPSDPLEVGTTPADEGAAEPLDEAAEEKAAAAEAAAIGGTASDYAGVKEPDLPASEAERPLAESGEGSAEGQEQADAALVENATVRDAGKSDAERQIDDTIEQAGDPAAGETPEPVPPEPATPTEDGDKKADDDDEIGGGEWQTWSGGAVKP